jgi:2-methylcitrate dehydratase PrpD
VTGAVPPPLARARAATAVLDTVGVALAGAAEPASRGVQQVAGAEGGGGCRVWGTSLRASAGGAALANGTAAHALDFDDMCFVSLAHPSAPLVPAALAAAEMAKASGQAVLDAYVVGFEIEGRLGRVMNPRHYQRGWHCTSTLGTIGAAAAVSRMFKLDEDAAAHALAIAASEASGLKENFGTMVKPLHAGLAARNGVLAAELARAGLTASALAIDGPQGFLHAMDSESESLDEALADLGRRWEIVDTGVTVKLYPSCAGTHPTLDVVLDLRRREGLLADDIERIDVDVDAITPTVLIYDTPATGLQAKFSLPFCVAAAIVYGRVGVETFLPDRLGDPAVTALMPRIAMRVESAFDNGAPALTQARVTVTLRDGRVCTERADGARGYPTRPASDAELDAKFLGCARGVISSASAERALTMLRDFEALGDVRKLTALLSG